MYLTCLQGCWLPRTFCKHLKTAVVQNIILNFKIVFISTSCLKLSLTNFQSTKFKFFLVVYGVRDRDGSGTGSSRM